MRFHRNPHHHIFPASWRFLSRSIPQPRDVAQVLPWILVSWQNISYPPGFLIIRPWKYGIKLWKFLDTLLFFILLSSIFYLNAETISNLTTFLSCWGLLQVIWSLYLSLLVVFKFLIPLLKRHVAKKRFAER